MCASLVFLGPWWGLRGLRRGGGGVWVGGAYFFPPEKNEMRVIGLQRVWFKLRPLGSDFCTLSQSAERNRPPGSLDVRTAAEKQPTCQSTWTDIGKWFPMIISRSTWRLWVSSRRAHVPCARQIPDQSVSGQPLVRNVRNTHANTLSCTWRPFCFLLHVSLWGNPSQMWTSPSGKSPTCSSPTRTSFTTGIISPSKPWAPSKTTTWTSISARSLRRICPGWMTENAWWVYLRRWI